jgi:hypothetical protein
MCKTLIYIYNLSSLVIRLLVITIVSSLCSCTQLEGTAQERMPNDAEVAQYNASASPENRIVCRDETPIGSNIPRRVCRYLSDIDATSQFHRDQLRRVLR